MEKITSLHFPETIAQYSSFRQLLLFFDNITQLQPAEDSFQEEDLLVKAGMLHQYAPLPFGNDLANFNRLIHDIQGHGSDFYGNSFSSLSTSMAMQVDESSVKELIALMKPKNEAQTDTRQADALFQARLLLRLNEIHEIEEEELREKIESINLKKSHLLAALKGDEEEFDPLAGDLNLGTGSEQPLRFKQRLKAWANLLLADKQDMVWLATTGPNDAFDLLKDAVDFQTRPEHLFTISLASPRSESRDPQDLSTFLAAFHNKTGACRKILLAHLKKAADTGVFEKDQTLSETLAFWEKTVQSLSANGAKKLAFHLFKMPFSELLIKGLGLKNAAPRETSVQNTVIGVLH